MKELFRYKTWRAIDIDLSKEGLNHRWGNYYETNMGNCIQFSAWTNMYSCAIPEIGSFECSSKDYNKYWPYTIKCYLLTNRPKFVRCSTTDRQNVKIEEALLENDFLPTGQVKSNHGNYMVTMWEWWPK